MNIKEIQKNVPHKPGVYLFLDKNNKVLYIGKAKNLYKRTLNYFNVENLTYRIKQMMYNAVDLKFHITESENDAFLLEAQMIKQIQPVYNILYRNGRTLYYLVISDHEFPRIEISNEYQKNAIGPFISYNYLNNLLSDILEIFKIRTCSNYFFNSRKRPCIEYHINKCSAPCVGKINKEEYKQNVEEIKQFFNGKIEKILKIFNKELKSMIKDEEFERAGEKLKQIQRLKFLKEKQNIFFPEIEILDVAIMEKNYLYIEMIRKGKVCDIVFIKYENAVSFEDMIFDYYADCDHRIIGPKLKHNVLPNYSDIVSSREKIALDSAKKRFDEMMSENNLKIEWCRILNIEKLDIAECYDCSHYNGKFAYCSMIAGNNEKLFKKKYKKWKFEQTSFDDLEIMKNGMIKRNEIGDFPDLIIIDGGLNQLNVAKKYLNFDKIIAFAKGENRKGGVVYDYFGNEIAIDNEKLLLWLEHMRDTAHNFAKYNARTKFEKQYK